MENRNSLFSVDLENGHWHARRGPDTGEPGDEQEREHSADGGHQGHDLPAPLVPGTQSYINVCYSSLGLGRIFGSAALTGRIFGYLARKNRSGPTLLLKSGVYTNIVWQASKISPLRQNFSLFFNLGPPPPS